MVLDCCWLLLVDVRSRLISSRSNREFFDRGEIDAASSFIAAAEYQVPGRASYVNKMID
jgi:hypothetical protein